MAHDVHLARVAHALDLPYEEVKARHDAGDEQIRLLRARVKRMFFGVSFGMGTNLLGPRATDNKPPNTGRK